jgi:hypothetical protein
MVIIIELISVYGYNASVKSKCAFPPWANLWLLTIFENMRQIPRGGDKKHVKMPRIGANKSVANPPPRGQLDCLAKNSRLSNYLKIKRILSSAFRANAL